VDLGEGDICVFPSTRAGVHESLTQLAILGQEREFVRGCVAVAEEKAW